MGTQNAIYALVLWLIDHVLTSSLAQIAVPFMTIFFLLRFFQWLKAIGSRGKMDDLRFDAEDALVQAQTVTSSNYSELHQQGFSNREIAHLRRQRAGSSLPSLAAQQRMRNRRLRIK